MTIDYDADRNASSLDPQDVREVFLSVGWPHAQVEQKIITALEACESLITAWDGDRLVGLVSAIGDGEFNACITWLLVHRDYQHQGIGLKLMAKILARLENHNQVMVISPPRYKGLWASLGFRLLTETGDDDAEAGLVAGYRWHPSPGIDYSAHQDYRDHDEIPSDGGGAGDAEATQDD